MGVSSASLAAPPRRHQRRLRVRGTSITLLSQVRERAEAELGFGVDYELLEFPTCQRRAAMDRCHPRGRPTVAA